MWPLPPQSPHNKSVDHFTMYDSPRFPRVALGQDSHRMQLSVVPSASAKAVLCPLTKVTLRHGELGYPLHAVR